MWEPCNCEPCRIKQKLDSYLHEIFKTFISIKDYDLKRAQEVFQNVFKKLTETMKEQCNYYRKYCTEVLYSGSVFDGTKVGRMDEFDMNIVVHLPINYDEIILENYQPGFLRLKITDAFDNLDKQQNWEDCHKVTREWRDSEKYLLQNKIRRWLQGVVTKALNKLKGQVSVNGTVYSVKYKESGPAYTIQIRSTVKEHTVFRLDVDVVPVIKFEQPRAPEGYNLPTRIQGKEMRDWFVVPKPSKGIQNLAHKNRCWRLSFHIHEKAMMRESQGLKTSIRLVKKLRDGLELISIASYYIKTLFLWTIQEVDKSYWCKKLSVLFYEMVEKLHLAVKDRKIMYFWHSDNNLLRGVNLTSQNTDEKKLKKVLDAIKADDCDYIAECLLTPRELTEFKNSDFYDRYSKVKRTSLSNQGSVQVSLQPPQPFQYANNAATASSDWKKWKRSFQIFYEACELSKKERKVQLNMTLHIIGDQCREDYYQFSEECETVDELLLKFDELFLPRNNLTVERHIFFSRDQKESESIEQYMFELNKLVDKCGFKDSPDDLVRDRMICGIKDGALRERLLGEVDLSAEKALGICRLAEVSREQAILNTGQVEHQVSEVSGNNHENQNASVLVNCERDGQYRTSDQGATGVITVRGRSARPWNFVAQCSWCGTKHRRGQCPAYGQKCDRCKRMNHFAEACWSVKAREDSPVNTSRDSESDN